MSERFNRPRTPPGPPPPSGSRKSSARGPASSSAASKSLSKSYNDRTFEKYDKSYKSSAYESSKDYSDDKYKSGKLSEKMTVSKYMSKSVYIDDHFKLESGSQYSSSSQRYVDKDNYSSKYPDKGRYGTDDKYSMASASTSATSQYSNKKYDEYVSYPGNKASRYPKQDASGSYYGSSYESYGSYDGYGADKHRGSGGYGSDRVAVGSLPYSGDKYGSGSGRLAGVYAGDKVSGGSTGYGSDKLSRGATSSYGGDKHGRGGGGGYGGDKHGAGNVGYGDAKSAVVARSRLYGEEDRRDYRSAYSPSRAARSDARGYSGGYDSYGYGASARSSEKQYLDRYVIGDSVVYGPPGQYPRNLQPSSSPGRRPPSPPSPPLMMSRNYNRYSATSPRRYSGRRSLSPTSSRYQSLSPSGRRPPSPPSRRPPSPDSLYMRGRDRSFETTRSKERYNNKLTSSRSPPRNDRGITNRRVNSRVRVDVRNRRESDRRLGSREKSNSLDSSKRGNLADHRSSDYQNAGSTRNWTKENYSTNTQAHRDDRNTHISPSRNARRDARSNGGGNRDRASSRRIEDRLSINPPSGSRRSPGARPRIGRNATSPRDGTKKPRRPDDLRLWIESRKNEGGKKATSQGHIRAVGKGATGGAAARSGDRSKLKRSRLGDPKRRLGGKLKKPGGGPTKRNKIINKYRRMAAKRGMRSGGIGSGGGGRHSNRSNREGGGNRKGEEGDGDNGEDLEDSKPGSTASIRRVIKKPRKVSQVNNLEIRPRVMGKPVKKLLKDPKEDSADDGGNRARGNDEKVVLFL